MSNPLFFGTSGPHDAKVLIVGEAWGMHEAAAQKPFVGAAGKVLDNMLRDAGLNRLECLATNVVSAQPPNNEFHHFLYANADKAGHQKQTFRDLYAKPPLREGVEQLRKLIETSQPDIIIGCGNVPLWALTDKASVTTKLGYKVPGGIMNWRGSQLFVTVAGRAIPFLPIIHPAAILRAWDLRYITVHDLRRASRFLRTKVWKQPELRCQPFPSYTDTVDTLQRMLSDFAIGPKQIVPDLETYARQHVVCVGLATNTENICIPFFWFDPDGKVVEHFTAEQEVTVLGLIKKALTHPNAQVCNQNLIYDEQFLRRRMGIHIDISFDTMLAQNLLYPGTPKSLERLASLYCEHYVYWKDESQDWAGKGDPRELFLYNCKDTAAVLEIAAAQAQLIVKSNKSQQWEWQLEQWRVARDMMVRGVNRNNAVANEMQQQLRNAAQELETWLLAAMPEDLRYTAAGGPWYSSPARTQDIFYNYLGLAPILHKKTKNVTANSEALTVLAKRHPWLTPYTSRIDALRSAQVFLSHFFSVKLPPSGRLLCNFNVGGTETFRWSSSSTAFDEGTNLQNIPKGDE